MKSITSCRAGNCTNFAGFLCRSCGRMMCRQHYNVSKGLCLACAAPEEGGCYVVGVLVGIAVLIGIVILIVSKNTGQPSSPTPIHIEQRATSAERGGKTVYCQVSDPNCYLTGYTSDPPVIELLGGGSLTFAVQIPQAGTYYMCIADYDGTIYHRGTLDVSVNQQLSYKIDPQGVLGSTSSSSCVTDNPIQLNSGTNSIQIMQEENPQYSSDCNDNSVCSPAIVFIDEIIIDQKSR